MTDPDPFPWLPLDQALAWTKTDPANDDKAEIVEQVRRAACEWVQDQRPDMLQAGVFQPKERTKMAARLAIARLLARQDSVFGFVAFEEQTAATILNTDPDVRRMIGRPRPSRLVR